MYNLLKLTSDVYVFEYETNGTNPLNVNVTTTFAYTGVSVNFTVPGGVFSINVDGYGAEGARPYGGWRRGESGKGGRLQATLAVIPGENLTIRVGQNPPNNDDGYTYTGGFNGGGAGGVSSGGNSSTASNGGIGIQLNQFSPYGFPSGWFAGGGGGGYFTTGGGSANRANNTTGGYYGGGGRGGSTGYSLYGEDAVNASGGGGGGGSSNNNGVANAGRGGSGIVIVRYQI